MISAAPLCQTNGLGSSFQCSTHEVIAAPSSLVDRWAPRRNLSYLVVSSASQRSMRVIHEV